MGGKSRGGGCCYKRGTYRVVLPLKVKVLSDSCHEVLRQAASWREREREGTARVVTVRGGGGKHCTGV